MALLNWDPHAIGSAQFEMIGAELDTKLIEHKQK